MRMNKQRQKDLIEMLKELHLPMFREYHQDLLRQLLQMNLAMRSIFMNWLRGNARFEGQTRLPGW